jgi:hypothetical protein
VVDRLRRSLARRWKSVLAKVQAVALAGFFFDQDFELQIFQIVRTPGIKVKNPGTPQYQQTAFVQYDFAPLLVPAPIVHVTAANWGSNTIQQLNFDLSNYRLVLENIPTRAVTPDQAGILPKYLIVVRLAGKQIGGTGHYKWLLRYADRARCWRDRDVRSRVLGERL